MKFYEKSLNDEIDELEKKQNFLENVELHNVDKI